MKLYAVSDGPPSLSVRMLLKSLDLKYELKNVDYCSGEHMTNEYALMNPQKEIPVLDDDGFFLSESVAILQYIADKYAPNSGLYPKDAKTRALVNHRLCFNLAFLYPNLSAYAMAPIFFNYERTPLALKKVNIALATFETYMKREATKYVAGTEITIADFPLICSIMCLEAIKLSIDDYPAVKEWYVNFKKCYPDLWNIAETGMKEIEHFEKNPPDLSNLNHPIHPAKVL